MKTKILYIMLLIAVVYSCSKESIVPSLLSVEGGEEVEFSIKDDWKIGSGSSLLWEFGDGNVSSEKNPIHIFKNAGNYTVTLSEFSKSGRLKQKLKPFIVSVTQLYKPRVKGLSAETESLDFIYKDLDSYLRYVLSSEVEEEIDDYTFEISVDGNVIGTSQYVNYVFQDTGNYQVSLKLFDKNGVSGTYDTTMRVGGETSYLRFKIPDANLAPLGTITERYLVLYKNTGSFNYSSDKQDFLDYPGPVATNNLISNGKLMSYYGPGYSDYFYWTFDPFGYIALSSISNGDFMQIDVPAHDGSYQDYNDLRAFLVIVGTNGLNMSEHPFTIIPGVTERIIDLPTPTFYPY